MIHLERGINIFVLLNKEGNETWYFDILLYIYNIYYLDHYIWGNAENHKEGE